MKKLLTFLAFSFFLFGQLWTQAPQSFSYQAVARDAAGLVLADQAVSFRISILQGALPGTAVYTETQNYTTNAFGLANLEIGTGTVTLGDFSTIDWGSDIFHVEVAFDPAGGVSYSLMGTSQLLSVPYAMHAQTVAEVDDADADPTNELQDLSLSGTDLTISGGSTVTLPSGGSDDDWAYFSGDGLTGEIYHSGDVALGTVTDPEGHGLYVQNYSSGEAAVRGTDQSGTNIYAEGWLGVLSPVGEPVSVTNIGVWGLKPRNGANGAAIYGWNDDDNSVNYAGVFVADGANTGTNYAVYALADSGATNVAGYFGGNVGINVDLPSQELHVKQTGANRAMKTEHQTSTDYWTTGIGISSLNYRWEFNGTGKGQISQVDGAYSTISDRRLKTGIQGLPEMLNNIMRLNPSSYFFKDAPSEKRSIGFISQEVEEIFPNLVRVDDAGYKLLAYADFGVIAIKGIQEQQEIIDRQQEEIDTLKAQVEEIRTMLKQGNSGQSDGR